MASALTIISSMATRLLLAEQAGGIRRSAGLVVELEAVGGVDAARRVEAGEPFDVVVLADNAIARLAESGHVDPATVTPLVRSGIAVAIRAGATAPRMDDEASLREAVLAATSVGYSTGPSGQALLKLFERWGIADTVASRIIQAPPGVPVGALIAEGKVALGFQQLSELMHLKGITVLGPLPASVQVTTVFSGAVSGRSARPADARALLVELASDNHDALIRRHGLEPAR